MSATRTCMVLLFLCSAPAVLLGQDGVRRVSLTEALESFGLNSIELGIARSEAAEIAGAARQSRAYANPGFSINRDDLGSEDARYWENTLRLVQQVEWPARTAARARAAAHAANAGAARLRADSIALAFHVREAYVRAWLAEETEAVVRQALTVVEGVAEDAELRLEAGDISAYRARRLRLARVQAERDWVQAALDARGARRRLAALIAPGSGVEEIGPSEGPAGVPPPVTRETALLALARRPDLDAAVLELDAARAGEEIAETYRLPTPTLGLGYRQQHGGLAGPSLLLDLPLPLFDRGVGGRQEAAARASGAARRLDLGRRLARYDLVAASDRHTTGRAQLEAAEAGLLADGAALLESALAAYAEDAMTLLELLDAANAFRSARTSALAVRAEAWIAYYDLLRAMASAPAGS